MKPEVVSRFHPVEVFVKLCKFRFHRDGKIKCGLSFWYQSISDP
jgi:hypothetical protein